jgi:hypothetical protein
MATDVGTLRPAARTRLTARISPPHWTAPAWASIGVVALFISITWWWLTQDRSTPIWDAGLHLLLSDNVFNALRAGHLTEAFTATPPYPPFTYLIGSLGILLTGFQVSSPILAQNFIFVPLLALGCYQVGRLAFGPLAGLLAVLFALGSPLIIPQFHVFMTDAPETAMVAVAVWLIIATEGFSRLWISSLAGVVVGFGMLTKEPFAVFVLGIVLVTIVRGKWQAWRGLALFAVIALALALPWYLHELTNIKSIGEEATASAKEIPHQGEALAPQGVAPPRMSRANWEWYIWSIINWQLFLPLFVFTAVGWVWMIVGFVRRRWVSPLAPELAVGSFLAWLILTQTFVHDARYSMPLLIYLAVLGTGWIVQLPRLARVSVIAVLVTVAIANTLGSSFGVGKQVISSLPNEDPLALDLPGRITYFSTSGWIVAAPRRDGDLLAMFRALRHEGVEGDLWSGEQAAGPEFSDIGVRVFSTIAGLQILQGLPLSGLSGHDAVLSHQPIIPDEAPPCVKFDDGSGVWVRLGNPNAHGARDYCPLPTPHFYGPREK